MHDTCTCMNRNVLKTITSKYAHYAMFDENDTIGILSLGTSDRCRYKSKYHCLEWTALDWCTLLECISGFARKHDVNFEVLKIKTKPKKTSNTKCILFSLMPAESLLIQQYIRVAKNCCHRNVSHQQQTSYVYRGKHLTKHARFH